MPTTGTQIDKGIAKLESQLAAWRTKLDELAAKASAKATATGHEAKVESKKQIEELRAKLAVAQTKLDEMKTAGSAKLETLKQGVDRLWHDVEGTFKKLVH
jgi:DNA repair exonuclease SbcCD ATPase subunit